MPRQPNRTKAKPKNQRGRPPKNSPVVPLDTKALPLTQLHPAVKPLAVALEKKTIADYVLAGFRPAEVAEKLDISLTAVYNAMKDMESELSSETQSIVERLRYINIARMERLQSVYFPRAIEGDQRAAELVLKISKLEDDLAEKTVPKDEDAARAAINIEHIELTITAGNPMFQIAQDQMEQDWLGLIDTPLEMLYTDVIDIPQIADNVGQRVTTIEEHYGKEFVEQSNDNNNTDSTD